MFFNREYIPAVPIREEQRLSEEEELARQLKREARIFFPDKKLPDFDEVDLPPLPKERQESDPKLPQEQEKAGRLPDRSPDRKQDTISQADHDAACREEDSMRRKADGSFSHHEIEAARREAEQITARKQQIQSNSPPVNREIGSQTGEARQNVRPRLNKQDLKRGIRLKVILDRPRGLIPWKGDDF